MGENVVFLVIFDTCDVMYNWSISLLPPIVLEKSIWVNVNVRHNNLTKEDDTVGLIIELCKTLQLILKAQWSNFFEY